MRTISAKQWYWNVLLTLTAIMLYFPPSLASAQFLQTDLYTYQLPSAKEELLVVLAEEGLFIAYVPKRTNPVAIVNLRNLNVENTQSVVLAYASGSQVPEKLLLPGEGNEFRIRGDFTLRLAPHIRIAVSMNSGNAPYISVLDDAKGAEAIVGFAGRQMMLNLGGSKAIELFEAGTFKDDIMGAAFVYDAKPDKQLYVSEQLVPKGTPIGLLNTRQNDCMLGKLPFIPAEVTEKLTGLAASQMSKEISKLSRSITHSDYFMLNSSKESTRAMNYSTAKFVELSLSKLGNKQVCLVHALDVASQ